MRVATVLFLLCFLVGCSTHQNPMEAGEEFIFVTADEDAIFKAAYNAMLEGRKESPIVEISGPVRGYTLTQNWALDYWTTILKIYPAKGTTEKGEIINGYYPDVSGDGSIIVRGPAMDKRIYESAIREFSKIAKKISVIKVEEGTYILDKGNKERSNVNSRLQNIDKLHKNGTITREEYIKAREKILNEL